MKILKAKLPALLINTSMILGSVMLVKSGGF